MMSVILVSETGINSLKYFGNCWFSKIFLLDNSINCHYILWLNSLTSRIEPYFQISSKCEWLFSCLSKFNKDFWQRKFLTILQRSRIQVWLYEQTNLRIEGCIIVSLLISWKSISTTEFFKYVIHWHWIHLLHKLYQILVS